MWAYSKDFDMALPRDGTSDSNFDPSRRIGSGNPVNRAGTRRQIWRAASKLPLRQLRKCFSRITTKRAN
jgi:hypothetical protein